MLFLVVAMATVCVWLWLFPPDQLGGRARAVLLGLSLLATLGSGWASIKAVDAMNQARTRALDEGRRLEREKEEAIRRIRGEEAGLGAAGR